MLFRSSRLNQAALRSVEIVRSGGSSLYGSHPLSGAIQFFPRDRKHIAVNVQGHSTGAYDISGSLGQPVSNNVTLFVNAKKGLAGNYYKIAEKDRGAVDEKAETDYEMLSARLNYLDDKWLVHVRGSGFREDRNNGTAVQMNETLLAHVDALTLYQVLPGLSLEWRGYFQNQDYDQTFSAVAENRDGENLVRSQNVPSQRFDTSLLGRWRIGSHHVQIGAAFNHKQGVSHETSYWAGEARSNVHVGGRQQNLGVFIQDRWNISQQLTAAASFRYDWIRNVQTDSSLKTINSGESHRGELFDQGSQAASPRLSFAWHVHESVKLRAATYRSFRSPTLNELYRGFRVGDILTAPNSQLNPEKSNGVEIGIDFTATLLKASVTFFQLDLLDAISNATIRVQDNLIYRQRQNIEAVRSQGVELEWDWRMLSFLALEAHYIYTNSRIRESYDERLVGKKTPQVPAHSAFVGARFDFSPLFVLIDGAWNSEQFDDDQNAYQLDGFVTIDSQLIYSLKSGIDIGLGVHNIFDTIVQVGRTPLLSIGQPRTFFLSLSLFR